MKRLLRAGLVLVILAQSLPAEAQQLRDHLVVHQLQNGMQFLFFRRTNAPVVSLVAVYNAGSSDESDGYTGVAHLLEHMAFKGTPWIGTRDFAREEPLLRRVHELGEALAAEELSAHPDAAKIAALRAELAQTDAAQHEFIVKDELDAIYTAHGGAGLNASTSTDFTRYYINLPVNKFELWALLEAQRMRWPILREVFTEREVVREERRQRYVDDPEGALWENLNSMAFRAHAYKNPVIGWDSDLRHLTPFKIHEFFNKHYIPQNAVVAIVGDVDPQAAIPVIEKYFGPWPAGEQPLRPTLVEPEMTGERRAKIEFNARPRLAIAYHKPDWRERTDVVIDVILSIMSEGRSSRLYDRLVKREQLAQEIEGFTGPGNKYPNLAIFWAAPRAPHTNAEVEAAIYAELERLKTEPVTERELQRVKNRLDGQFLRSLQSNSGLANQLAYYTALTGDPYYIEKNIAAMKSVTAEEIMQTARAIFTPTNRTVVEVVTKEQSTVSSEQ